MGVAKCHGDRTSAYTGERDTDPQLQEQLETLAKAGCNFTDNSSEVADAKTQFQVGLAKLEYLQERASR